MSPEEIAAVLGKAELFESLDGQERLLIARHAKERTFEKGNHIFTEGDPGDSFFVLAKGRVKVFVSSVEGAEVVLVTLAPGDLFGELALLDHGDRSASAAALEPCTVISLERSILMEMLQSEPGIGDSLLRALGTALRRLTGQAADLVFLDLQGRVAKLLIQMAEKQPSENQEIVLDLGMTQTDLASMVGGSRQAVNRILHGLAARGFIDMEARTIMIRDRAALMKRAGLST
jgi:CRP-like cAMP-binding protein